MFLLLTLLAALVASLIKMLDEVVATGLVGKDLLVREYELRRCGRFLAMQANLHASVAIIAHYQPAEFERERLLTAIANFTTNYKAEHCRDTVLGLKVEVYQQDNPMLPAFWANYAFRFVSYRQANRSATTNLDSS
ncbi:MAG: hypothetical protein OYH77_02465 [Pseudomonadota bacterium]|nr:hypothetical protein [Pseudomonadota bacterium]